MTAGLVGTVRCVWFVLRLVDCITVQDAVIDVRRSDH